MSAEQSPRVSCVMVTADRPTLVKRAILCYLKQTYPNKELIVLDNGHESVEALLSEVPTSELVYKKIERTPDLILGDIRNTALHMAKGDFIIPQWDDDDWYHPERIRIQVDTLLRGYDACALLGTLMHVDNEPYFTSPYIGLLPKGVPPTIMHRRDDTILYPSLPRTEDTVYVNEWRNKSYYLLPASYSYLYIRSFHGANTWEVDHFLRRMRNTPLDTLRYVWYRFIRRKLTAHPRFKLSKEMQDAFELYLSDSRLLGIFASSI